MKENKNIYQNTFIIGGTLKAATSSVFTYLSAHPEVCGSLVKETAFFENEYTDNHKIDFHNYSHYFKNFKPSNKSCLEASPGYLANEKIASRIKTLLPDAKLIFILRDPVDRLYSYYNFHIGQLTKDFDRTNTFEEYIEVCMKYSAKKGNHERFKMHERHLRALEIGKYSRYLKNFYCVFPKGQIKVMFYEHLKDNVRDFITCLCDFLNIDEKFYDDYGFHKVNVTQTSRMKIFHYIALKVNKKLEYFLRQRPEVKNKIAFLYNLINRKKLGYPSICQSVKLKLEDYYSSSNNELTQLLLGEKCPSWVK